MDHKDQIDFFKKWVSLAAEDAQERKDLRSEDKGWLEWAVATFKERISNLQSVEDFTLAEATFVIGFYAPDPLKKSRDGGAEGGKKSGIARRKKPEFLAAREHALEIAKSATAKAALSQEKVVNEIKWSWKIEAHCPDSQLKAWVREWQQNGLILRKR